MSPYRQFSTQQSLKKHALRLKVLGGDCLRTAQQAAATPLKNECEYPPFTLFSHYSTNGLKMKINFMKIRKTGVFAYY